MCWPESDTRACLIGATPVFIMDAKRKFDVSAADTVGCARASAVESEGSWGGESNRLAQLVVRPARRTMCTSEERMWC